MEQIENKVKPHFSILIKNNFQPSETKKKIVKIISLIKKKKKITNYINNIDQTINKGKAPGGSI